MDGKLMLEMYRAFRAGAPLGDVAVMKLAALREAPDGLKARLGKVSGYAPQLSFEALDQLPEGTLGAEYARFLRSNDLEHLTISPECLKRFADRPFAVRYTVTHDLHHLLAGFDTGVAGEMGVLGFNIGQGTAPIGDSMFGPVGTLYSLLSPSQRKASRHNYALGRHMGERAQTLIAEPLEDWLAEPIDTVRNRVGIELEDVKQAMPSGKSWLVRAVYAQGKSKLPAPLRS